jgi:hypothetical protein
VSEDLRRTLQWPLTPFLALGCLHCSLDRYVHPLMQSPVGHSPNQGMGRRRSRLGRWTPVRGSRAHPPCGLQQQVFPCGAWGYLLQFYQQSVFRLPWHRDPRHTPRFALRPGWFTRTPDRIAASATHDGLGRLFRHRLWALLAPRVSVQSSLGRTRRDSILANRSQSKLRCVERAGPPSTQTRSDSPALGRLSPGRGLSQDGNRSSFGPHPESATGRPSVYSGARHRGIRPDPQDLASAQLYRRPQLREAHSQPAESR